MQIILLVTRNLSISSMMTGFFVWNEDFSRIEKDAISNTVQEKILVVNFIKYLLKLLSLSWG